MPAIQTGLARIDQPVRSPGLGKERNIAKDVEVGCGLAMFINCIYTIKNGFDV